MVVLGWLAQNSVAGFAFGSFGPLVTTFERQFHVSRSISSLGLPLVVLSLGLLSPVVGFLVRYVSIRTLMIAGAMLIAAGYSMLAAAHAMSVVLWGYAVLVGPGCGLLGALLPSTLVARWFVAGRGRALGIVNMPALVAIVPIGASWLLSHEGMSAVFAAMAAATLCLIPALFLIVDRPEQRGLRPIGLSDSVAPPSSVATLSYRAIMRQPVYWAMTLSGGVLSGGAITIVTHIVPMAEGWGISPAAAALLATASGATGALGSPLFGWLADKLGGTSALAVNAAAQALLWLLLLAHPAFPALLALAAVLGFATGGVNALMGTAFSERFGAENFGSAYGLYVLAILPFIVGVPPLAGYLFDVTGSYTAPFLGQIAAICAVVAMGVALRKGEARRRAALAPIARA